MAKRYRLNVANLEDIMAALESGDTYVNVHAQAHPGGEIRGQIR